MLVITFKFQANNIMRAGHRRNQSKAQAIKKKIISSKNKFLSIYTLEDLK